MTSHTGHPPLQSLIQQEEKFIYLHEGDAKSDKRAVGLFEVYAKVTAAGCNDKNRLITAEKFMDEQAYDL